MKQQVNAGRRDKKRALSDSHTAALEKKDRKAAPSLDLTPCVSRTGEEEALVTKWKTRTLLKQAPEMELTQGGQLAPTTNDATLWWARVGALLHTESLAHSVYLIESLTAAMGLEDPGKGGTAGLGTVHGLAPQDHLEALLAVQMAATHGAALQMLGRARCKDQPSAVVDACVSRATRLMRTFAEQVRTFKDYRSRGQQTVTVQHVNVSGGAQAIVGDLVLQKGTSREGGGE